MSRAALPDRARGSLDAARRGRELDELAGGREVDVLVVGGGITGAGVALDAVTRGLSVALIERGDLATGTSRWSSKLAHGGLRYLSQGHFDIAWESARERAILIDGTAPFLARPLPMLIPLDGEIRGGTAAKIELGLRIGDAMRALSGTSRRRLPSARRIAAAEAQRLAPALRADGLRGALLHWDAQLEDDARLVTAVARTAAAHGARVLTRVAALSLHDQGATVRDQLGGATFELRARHVVNAAGVWAGSLAGGVALRPSRGSHLLVPAERLGDPRATVNASVEGSIGHFVFATPRPDGLVLIGLTDEPANGDDALADAPAITGAEEDWLLRTVSRAFERPLGREDVVGRFAGLRPLVEGEEGDTADLSRRHAVIEDERSAVLTVVGGKLTTYRRMAQDAVDRIAARPGVAAGPCRTRRLALLGARGRAPRSAPPRLVRRYGSEATDVLDLAAGRRELLAPLAPGIPVIGAEVRFAVERELALTVDDVLDRRTRLGLVPERRAAAREAVERLVPETLEAVG